MRALISNRDYEQLSAYLDGQLSSREKHKLEERIRARSELQEVLNDLKNTKALLRMVPHRRAPRNFTLTPAMVEDIESRRKRTSRLNLFPALSFASAVATLALVASLVFQWLPGQQPLSTANQLAKEVAMQSPASPGLPAALDSSGTGEEAAEVPAEPETSMSAQAATVVGVLAAPTATSDVQKSESSSIAAQPPIVTWNNPDNSVEGFGMGGESAPLPSAKGIGGGAGGGPGMSTLSEPLPGGAILVPLEGVTSLEQTQPAIEAAPPSAETERTAQQGGGPILGIPPADQGGQIADSFAWGASPGTGQAHEISPNQPAASPISVTLVQALLALIALLTGASAVFLRKRN